MNGSSLFFMRIATIHQLVALQATPDHVPLLKLTSVQIGDSMLMSTMFEDLGDDYFELIGKRYIEFTSFENLLRRHPGQSITRSGPPRYGAPLRIKGWFGWMDDYKFISTTTTGPLDNGDMELTLTTVTGLRKYDIVSIVPADSTKEPVNIFVNSIDTALNKIFFDEIELPESVPSGASALRFGQVPRAIRKAAMIMVGMDANVSLADGSGVPGLVASESVGDVSISYGGGKGLADPAITGKYGEIRVDSILNQFRRPITISSI
jgi:hypothetical protein